VIEKLRLRHHAVGMGMQIRKHIISPRTRRQVQPVEARHPLIFEDLKLHLSQAFSCVTR